LQITHETISVLSPLPNVKRTPSSEAASVTASIIQSAFRLSDIEFVAETAHRHRYAENELRLVEDD
jgi:hypothetical protein